MTRAHRLSSPRLNACHLSGHFRPLDPYGIHDANDGYPQHYCELNEDEYGRPFLGPYDRYLRRPSIVPVVPSPRAFCGVTIHDQPTANFSQASHVTPIKRRQAELEWPGYSAQCISMISSNECNLKGISV